MNKNQLNCYVSNPERVSNYNTIVCIFAKSFNKSSLVKG